MRTPPELEGVRIRVAEAAPHKLQNAASSGIGVRQVGQIRGVTTSLSRLLLEPPKYHARPDYRSREREKVPAQDLRVTI